MRHKRFTPQPVIQRPAPFVVRWAKGEEPVKSLGFNTMLEANAEFERLCLPEYEAVLSDTTKSEALKSWPAI